LSGDGNRVIENRVILKEALRSEGVQINEMHTLNQAMTALLFQFLKTTK
jgi:hypothetical protein